MGGEVVLDPEPGVGAREEGFERRPRHAGCAGVDLEGGQRAERALLRVVIQIA